MRIVGVDPELAVTLNKLELEHAILHGDEDFVKDTIAHKGLSFYVCHFIIRGQPRSVVLLTDEPRNLIHVCSWREGHLRSQDYSIAERDIWVDESHDEKGNVRWKA